MTCKAVCPFRTLPEDVQLKIYGRMCERELKELAKICAEAEKFVKKNFWSTLKLDAEDTVTITADANGIFVFVAGPSYKGEGKKLDIDSYSTIAPLSINHLTIVIRDGAKWPRVSQIVNKLHPVCQSASFYGGHIPSMCIVMMLEFMKCPKGITLDCYAKEKGIQLIESLRTIENTTNSHLRIKETSDCDDLLDELRVFGRIEVESTYERIDEFVNDLEYGKDLGNLEEFTLSIKCVDPNISLTLICGAMLLMRKKNRRFSVLHLFKKCLFIEETTSDGRHFAYCKVMSSDTNEVLDLLLDKMYVSKKNRLAFGPEQRSFYMCLDDEDDREKYLKMIVVEGVSHECAMASLVGDDYKSDRIV